MFDDSFYGKEELIKLGLKKIGYNVLISKKCSIYSASSIAIGDNVRIDDFCILSGNIRIGNCVHISAYSALYGGGEITIGNFCGLSPRSIIFSQTDNFSGGAMIGPMVPETFRKVFKAPVKMDDYSQLGANTIVMPGVICGEGSVTGAFSFVTSNLDPWSVNCGIPSKKVKDRKKIKCNIRDNGEQ